MSSFLLYPSVKVAKKTILNNVFLYCIKLCYVNNIYENFSLFESALYLELKLPAYLFITYSNIVIPMYIEDICHII